MIIIDSVESKSVTRLIIKIDNGHEIDVINIRRNHATVKFSLHALTHKIIVMTI